MRLSAFSVQTKALAVESADDAYETLFGLGPEQEELRNNKLIRKRQGQAEGIRTELLEQPTRVDATWMSAVQLEFPSDADRPSSIGDLTTIDKYLEAAAKLSAICVDVVRVACGALLFIPADSVESSYSQMQQLIPTLNLDYNLVSEFTLQVNRFTSLQKMPSLRLNRLMQLASVSTAAVTFPAVTHTVLGHWTQLIADVNTDGSNTVPFEQGQLSEIWAELFQGLKFISETPYGPN